MERLSAYLLRDKEGFKEGLKGSNFRINGLATYSQKEGCSSSLGYFAGQYFFVNNKKGLNDIEINERSRLLKLADDFKL